MILPFISAVTDAVKTVCNPSTTGGVHVLRVYVVQKKKKFLYIFYDFRRAPLPPVPSTGTIATREGHLIYSFRPWSSGFSVLQLRHGFQYR